MFKVSSCTRVFMSADEERHIKLPMTDGLAVPARLWVQVQVLLGITYKSAIVFFFGGGAGVNEPHVRVLGWEGGSN